MYFYRYDDNSLEQTGPISVKVTTAFWREESFFHHDIPSDHQPKNARFAYRYRITLKMDPKAHQSDTCQLETRHWEITDEQGNVETVDGPGVVGKMFGSGFFSFSCRSIAPIIQGLILFCSRVLNTAISREPRTKLNMET